MGGGGLPCPSPQAQCSPSIRAPDVVLPHPMHCMHPVLPHPVHTLHVSHTQGCLACPPLDMPYPSMLCIRSCLPGCARCPYTCRGFAGNTALSSNPCSTSPSMCCACTPYTCLAAASSPRNVGEASFLHEVFRACLVPPLFALVSPKLSFLSSQPCSSFLPFDVPPLLCSRV